MCSTNLILYFEFTAVTADGMERAQWTFEDFHGVPIPKIGDCICPGQGEYKILKRTFGYDNTGFTIYFLCEPVPF